MRGFMVLLLLTSCAGWPSGSYQELSNPADAQVLIPAIASYVARQPHTSIRVESAPGEKETARAIEESLISSGIGVDPSGETLRYLIFPLDQGTLLRVSLGSSVGAQFFRRGFDGRLKPAGPIMQGSE